MVWPTKIIKNEDFPNFDNAGTWLLNPQTNGRQLLFSARKTTSMKLSDNSITMPTTLNLMRTSPFKPAVEIQSFIHFMFANGQIDKHTRDFLIPHHSRAARFYLSPKIHKPGNPGRLIVSSNSDLTENRSWFMDWFLQPFATSLLSYIQDTTDFLNSLSRLPSLPPETLLVTLNVSSLYTNIPHERI